MPRFQIKRKKKETEPEVLVEEKIDETEMSLESTDEESIESEPLSEAFETLEVTKKADNKPKQQTEPQYATPRRTREATIARQQTNYDQYGNHRQTYAPQRQQMHRQPRSLDYTKPSRSRNGRPVLQYKSCYGANAARLTTQDKARRLYYSAFG